MECSTLNKKCSTPVAYGHQGLRGPHGGRSGATEARWLPYGPTHPPNPDRRSWGDSDALQGTSQGQDGVKKPLNGILAILEYITFVSWPPANFKPGTDMGALDVFCGKRHLLPSLQKKFLFSTGAPSERGSLDGAWGT